MTTDPNAAGTDGPPLTTGDDEALSEPEPEPRDGEKAVAKARAAGKKAPARPAKPTSLRELIELTYRGHGRPVRLTRNDLSALVAPAGTDAPGPDWLSDLARKDPFLRVPPQLLIAASRLRPNDPNRQALVELTHRVLSIHPLYHHYVANSTPADDDDQPPFVSSAKVSDAAKKVTAEVVGVEPAAYRDAQRELLRDNAVISFALLWVLQGRWSRDQFIAEMTSAVWSRPAMEAVSHADVAVALATAGERQALNHLVGHFTAELRRLTTQLNQARDETRDQQQRAECAEADTAALNRLIESERARADQLEEQITALTSDVETERTNRFVDKSHLTDDYEVLRTQVIRRLASQVELLNDGLHALRSGSVPVAEEFVDRALTAIQKEVARLKEIGGTR